MGEDLSEEGMVDNWLHMSGRLMAEEGCEWERNDKSDGDEWRWKLAGWGSGGGI